MCYQCSQCNRCGRFSYKTVLVCKTCNTPIQAGQHVCSGCNASTIGNLKAGEMLFDTHAPVRGKRERSF